MSCNYRQQVDGCSPCYVFPIVSTYIPYDERRYARNMKIAIDRAGALVKV